MNYELRIMIGLPYNLITLKPYNLIKRSSEVQEFRSSDDTTGRYCLPYNLKTLQPYNLIKRSSGVQTAERNRSSPCEN